MQAFPESILRATTPSCGRTSSTTSTSCRRMPTSWMAMRQTWSWSAKHLRKRSPMLEASSSLLEVRRLQLACAFYFFYFFQLLLSEAQLGVSLRHVFRSYIRDRSGWPHCLQWTWFKLSFQDSCEDPGKGNNHRKRTILWLGSLQGAHHGTYSGSGYGHGCRGGQKFWKLFCACVFYYWLRYLFLRKK